MKDKELIRRVGMAKCLDCETNLVPFDSTYGSHVLWCPNCYEQWKMR